MVSSALSEIAGDLGVIHDSKNVVSLSKLIGKQAQEHRVEAYMY